MKATQTTNWQRFIDISLKILAFLLWLITTIFSIASIYFLYQISLSIFAHFSSDVAVGTLIGYVVAILAAFTALITIIVLGEYHRKHFGKRESWTIFAWTVAIELLILILRFVV